MYGKCPSTDITRDAIGNGKLFPFHLSPNRAENQRPKQIQLQGEINEIHFLRTDCEGQGTSHSLSRFVAGFAVVGSDCTIQRSIRYIC
jgi:hypothetical protein